MRVGIWAAVSSVEQAAEDRISLTEQEERGREWAEAVGGEVVAVFRCVHSRSGYVFWPEAEAEIPEYRHVREHIEAGKLDAIYTIHTNRLGRDPALVAQFESLANRHGCEIYKANMPHTLGQQTVAHRYLAQFGAVSAGEELEELKRRWRMGMRGRVRNLGLIGTNPPAGYEPIRDEKGRTISYAKNGHAALVEEVTRLYLEGHAYAEIARRMNDSPFRPKHGGVWHPTTIRGMMLNDTYAGLPSFGPLEWDGEPQFEPYWSEEVHAAILRERRRRSKAPPNHPTGNPYIGCMFCARCGGAMVQFNVHRGRQVEHYYRCGTHVRKSWSGVACHNNNVPRHKITAAISEDLERLSTPEALDQLVAEYNDSGGVAELQRQIAESEAQMADLHDQRARIASAYGRKVMDDDIYRTQDDSLKREIAAYESRLADLRRQVDAVPDLDHWREQLSGLAQDFPNIVEEFEPDVVAAQLQRAGLRVEVEENEVVSVTWRA